MKALKFILCTLFFLVLITACTPQSLYDDNQISAKQETGDEEEQAEDGSKD